MTLGIKACSFLQVDSLIKATIPCRKRRRGCATERVITLHQQKKKDQSSPVSIGEDDTSGLSHFVICSGEMSHGEQENEYSVFKSSGMKSQCGCNVLSSIHLLLYLDDFFFNSLQIWVVLCKLVTCVRGKLSQCCLVVLINHSDFLSEEFFLLT